MFQCVNECFIVEHWLVISFFLFSNLLHEEFLLDEWIVQFCVCVTELVVVDEKLESFCQSWFWSVVLGQRWHGLWVFNDEGWVQALSFEEASDKLVNQPVGGSWLAAVNVMLFALLIEEVSGLFSFDILGDWFSKFLFEFFHHWDSSPWGSEIDF